MTRIDTVPEHFDTEDILDDLPAGSIVRRVDDGMPFIRREGTHLWDRPGRRGGTDPSYITPFTVLFVPGRDLVQEAQANAWDEGHAAGASNVTNVRLGIKVRDDNPYTQEAP